VPWHKQSHRLSQACVCGGILRLLTQSYTTVGFVTDPLPVHWQLITVIMAASGFFSFGWSTAVMFLLSQALFPSEN
jgi:hypothetical protein